MSGPIMSLEQCRALFERPSIEHMKQDPAFGSFVSYTLSRAGYGVQISTTPIAHYQLFNDGKVGGRPDAYALVRKWTTNVGPSEIVSLQGLTQGRMPGYLIATTGFTSEAYRLSADSRLIQLMDLPLLRRYIDYVRGTRLEGSVAPALAPDCLFAANGTQRRDKSKTRVITIANNKGGEGKTTTAIYLAKRLAERGNQVLLVDLDAQANLTSSLPDDKGQIDGYPSLVNYFDQPRSLSSFVRRTQLKGVWLIPSDRMLRLANTGRSTNPGTELHFVEHLHDKDVRPVPEPGTGPDRRDFDWIILDTPPDLTFHTRAALAASHYVIVPTSPGPYADSGLNQVLDTVEAMRGLIGGDIRVLGCVVTKWQDTSTHRDAVNQLKQSLLMPNQIHVFDARIPFDANIVKDERGRFHVPGLGKKPAAVKYDELAEEVLRHVNND